MKYHECFLQLLNYTYFNVNPLDPLERKEFQELDSACQIAVLTPVSLGKRHALFSTNLNKMEEATLY